MDPRRPERLTELRAERRRAEEDITLLQNRLARLQHEEQKALKKIEETKRRAQQIILLKARNERQHLRRQLESEYKQRQADRAKQRLQMSKLEQSSSLHANLDALKGHRAQEADQVRKQRALIKSTLEERESKLRAHKVAVAEVIKGRQAEVQRQKMLARLEHEEALQVESEHKLVVEEQRRRDADVIVSQLEQQEEKAIDSLRRTQEAQKVAYEELESALLNPAPPEAYGQILASGPEDGGGGASSVSVGGGARARRATPRRP